MAQRKLRARHSMLARQPKMVEAPELREAIALVAHPSAAFFGGESPQAPSFSLRLSPECVSRASIRQSSSNRESIPEIWNC